MLNHKGLQVSEQEARAESLKIYLIKNLINTTLDDFGFLQKPAPQYKISLLNALSQERISPVSSNMILERVKLIVNAVMQSKSTKLIGTFGPDLLNLVLFACLQLETSAKEKRLLIDQAYHIVQTFDGADLKQYVEMGAWEKVVQCEVLARTLDAVTEANINDESMTESLKKQPLFVILLFDLDANIKKINSKATSLSPSN